MVEANLSHASVSYHARAKAHCPTDKINPARKSPLSPLDNVATITNMIAL
jgi:hypothetical protein